LAEKQERKCSSPHTPPFKTSALTDKKEKKIFLIYGIRKFRGIGCKVIYTLLIRVYGKYWRIYSYIRKPCLIYDFAPDPI
jgi:hypothetical protein